MYAITGSHVFREPAQDFNLLRLGPAVGDQTQPYVDSVLLRKQGLQPLKMLVTYVLFFGCVYQSITLFREIITEVQIHFREVIPHASGGT